MVDCIGMLLPPKRYPLCTRPRQYTPLYAQRNHDDKNNVPYDVNSTSHDIYTVNKYPSLFETCSNPIHVLIFLALFSVWFGGFTRRQIYDFLNKNKN